MSDSAVRIVRLEGMWVASVRARGEHPEREALAKILAWAGERDLLLKNPSAHPIYGFDDPPFGRRGAERGYECWIRLEGKPAEGEAIDGDLNSRGDASVTLKRFDGGLYAVARCEIRGDPWDAIPAAWERLSRWVTSSGRRIGAHQSLELHCDPTASEDRFDLDLFFPVRDAAPAG